ncbi:MAG TPA: NHL repeat-containing protein [Verrucomicrobiae bacterium]|jgi:streptogramin lyase|nr:NHL repeat-containing protein [Verrucomicrobiae bacterium]
MKPFPAPGFFMNAAWKRGISKKPGAILATALALAAALVIMSPARLGAQNSFTMYVANELNYGQINQRYFTIGKFDAHGNASVFATNSSFSNPILSNPFGIALDSSGNVYVGCTQDNTWIEEFNPSGTTASRFVSATVSYPEGMIFDSSGNLYVANYYSGIEEYNPNGHASVFATATRTSGLTGLAFDAAGNLYVTDGYNGVIDICDSNGNLNTYASPGHTPYGLAFDNSGNLYVALNGNGTIVKYDAQTNQTLFASLGSGTQPTGVAFDSAGNLYVAEYAANKIVKIDPQANVTLFSTNGLNGPMFLVIQQGGPTTIDPANHYSYGANFGWMDWHGTGDNGASYGVVIGEYVCSGYIYSANVGWINLGSGAPTNGIHYQNLAADDFGVNQDGLGNLRGFAWGANIGWLNFETNGAPEVNLQTGILSGYVWSANCGWISLSNAFAYVQTDTIAPGLDSTGDGIPDAWALQYFGTTNINPNADPDRSGMTLLEDYLAGTDPNNPSDVLEITDIGFGTVTPGYTSLQWTSKPSRAYAVQYRATLDNASAWADVADYGLGADRATFNTGNTNGYEYYRVRAFRPLIP